MNSFEETGLKQELLEAISEMGFVEPTPIQALTIPHLLTSDRDIIALAQTGTGKTAAFGLPALHLTDVKNKKTQTLILCPTRELCLQIARDLESYAKFMKGVGVVAVYGGASADTQIRAIRKAGQIIVGTPGRTRDLINRGKLVVSNIERIILDEADEMLTMGFKEELDAILENTPDDKQTLLFSATMSKDIIRVTKKYMDDPVEHSVARVNVGAENVQHVYYTVQAKDKYEVLKRIADINPNIYGIVFCRTRRDTKEISNKLIQDGYSADSLHGDLSQAQRDKVMERFRNKQLQVLVATDVAARGLDVNSLTHVINFTLPDTTESYTHRSGRTGRAGKNGISVAIVHSRELRKIRDIEKRSGIVFKQEVVPTGKDICSIQLLKLIDKIVKVEVDEKQIEPFLPAIYEQFESLDREQLIKHFVSTEFNRFLAYYKNARDINYSSRSRDGGRDRDRDRGRDRDRRDGRDGRDRRDRDRRDGRDRDSRDSRDRDRGRDRDRRDSRDRDSRDSRDRDRRPDRREDRRDERSYDRDRERSSDRRDNRDRQDGGERRERRSEPVARIVKEGFSRMYINVGTKNDLDASRLMGIVNEALDSSSAEIGKIDIMKKFSFFEVDSSVERDLVKGLNGTEFEGVPIVVEVSENKAPPPFTSKKKSYKPGPKTNAVRRLKKKRIAPSSGPRNNRRNRRK